VRAFLALVLVRGAGAAVLMMMVGVEHIWRRLLFNAVAGNDAVLFVVSVRVGGERLLSSAVRERWRPLMGRFGFVLGRSVVDTIVAAGCEG